MNKTAHEIPIAMRAARLRIDAPRLPPQAGATPVVTTPVITTDDGQTGGGPPTELCGPAVFSLAGDA